MVVRIRKFIAFIGNARIKNKIRFLFYQPYDMSMRQFCRIAFGFTGNGVNAKLINAARRLRGKQRAELKHTEKDRPERIIFIHI